MGNKIPDMCYSEKGNKALDPQWTKMRTIDKWKNMEDMWTVPGKAGKLKLPKEYKYDTSGALHMNPTMASKHCFIFSS